MALPSLYMVGLRGPGMTQVERSSSGQVWIRRLGDLLS